MKITRSIVKASFLCFALLGLNHAQASLTNGDFETGDTSSWSSFTTSNGTLGTGRPTVSIFDVAGTGTGSHALGLSVGYATAPCAYPGIFCPQPIEGGGIRQTSYFSAGLATLHADVAVHNSLLYGGSNRDGGTFSLMLDGLVLDTFTVGNIVSGSTQRGTLDAEIFLAAGFHTFEILVTRMHAQSLSLTQVIDNVSLTQIPEPSLPALLALGVLGLAAFRAKGTSTR